MSKFGFKDIGLKEELWFHYPALTQTCSNPLYCLILDHHHSSSIFHYIVRQAAHSDKMAKEIAGFLLKITKDEAEIIKHKETVSGPDKNFEWFSRLERIIVRNLVTVFVDSFLWYLAEIVKLAMSKRPEMLKSGEHVRVEEILEMGSMEELISHLIEKKLNELSYGGFDKIEKFINDTLGINAFSDPRIRSALKVFIEVRNINAHNRGIVNKTFLKRVDGVIGHGYISGDSVNLTSGEIFLLSQCVMQSAVKIDEAVARKFGLETVRIIDTLPKEEQEEYLFHFGAKDGDVSGSTSHYQHQ